MALSFDKNRSKINWLPMTTSQVFQNFSQRTSCLLVRRFYAHKVKWNTEISEHLLFTNKASWVLKINFSPSTIWINCSTYLKKFANSRPSASNFKGSLDHPNSFFLTVGQNNFGNKIPDRKWWWSNFLCHFRNPTRRPHAHQGSSLQLNHNEMRGG